MSYCPIRYARDNVIIDHTGRAGAVYRLPEVSYPLRSDDDKFGWNLVMCGIALGARADLTIHRVTRRYDTSLYVPQATGFVDTNYQSVEAWRKTLAAHEDHIQALNSHPAEIYMRVSLEDPTNALKIVRTIDRAARRVSEAAGVGADAPIMQCDIREHLRKQHLTLDRMQTAMPDVAIRPVTTQELQWLCMRNAVAHVDEPHMDPWWLPDALIPGVDGGAAVRPMPGDFRRLFSAEVTRESDHVVVVAEGANGTCTSYQATVVLGMLPHEGITFPGLTAELMFAPLDGLDFPVDATAHFEWVTNQRALSEVRRRHRVAEDRIQEAFAAAREPSHRTRLTPELAKTVEEILTHESKPPMFDGTIMYRVGAPSLDELNHRVALLREQFPSVSTHRPPADQDLLWRAHMLHPTTVVTDWTQRLTLDQFAMLMPIAGRPIGDTRGVYFAHTTGGGSYRPVLIDPGRPAEDASPDTSYFTGRQGSGKTVAALTKAAEAGMRGGTVITLDPKKDHHITDLPEFAGESETVSLSAESNSDRGRMDPLVAPPKQVQEIVALSYYRDLLPDIDVAGRRELMSAIKVARTEGSGSLGVIRALLAGNAIAAELGRSLELFSDFGLGRLGFSDGTINEDRDQIARITTFTMASMGLPDADVDPKNYDDRQRMAVATFKLLIAYTIGIVARDPRDHKTVMIDEAWVFDGPDGQQLLNQLARLMRSYNGTLLICSQTVSDLGAVKDLISMYFIGGTNNTDEAKVAARLIGLDPEDTGLCAAMANKRIFCKGIMLFRDSEGNVEVVQVDPPAHWLKILDTRPPTPGAAGRKVLV